tara:strand:+ start:322 stop:3249 length:2928 start_codon:yes stop_codon:yes gene_type:complete
MYLAFFARKCHNNIINKNNPKIMNQQNLNDSINPENQSKQQPENQPNQPGDAESIQQPDNAESVQPLESVRSGMFNVLRDQLNSVLNSDEIAGVYKLYEQRFGRVKKLRFGRYMTPDMILEYREDDGISIKEAKAVHAMLLESVDDARELITSLDSLSKFSVLKISNDSCVVESINDGKVKFFNDDNVYTLADLYFAGASIDVNQEVDLGAILEVSSDAFEQYCSDNFQGINTKALLDLSSEDHDDVIKEVLIKKLATLSTQELVVLTSDNYGHFITQALKFKFQNDGLDEFYELYNSTSDENANVKEFLNSILRSQLINLEIDILLNDDSIPDYILQSEPFKDALKHKVDRTVPGVLLSLSCHESSRELFNVLLRGRLSKLDIGFLIALDPGSNVEILKSVIQKKAAKLAVKELLNLHNHNFYSVITPILEEKLKKLNVNDFKSTYSSDQIYIKVLEEVLSMKLLADMTVDQLKDLVFIFPAYNTIVCLTLKHKIDSIFRIDELLNLNTENYYHSHVMKKYIGERLRRFNLSELLAVDSDNELLQTVIHQKLSKFKKEGILRFSSAEFNSNIYKYVKLTFTLRELVEHKEANVNVEKVLNERLESYRELDVRGLLKEFKNAYIVGNLSDFEKQVINDRIEQLIKDPENLATVLEYKSQLIELSNALDGKYKLERTFAKDDGSTSVLPSLYPVKVEDGKREVQDKKFISRNEIPEYRKDDLAEYKKSGQLKAYKYEFVSSAYHDFDKDIMIVVQKMPFFEVLSHIKFPYVGSDLYQLVIDMLNKKPYDQSTYEKLMNLRPDEINEINESQFYIITNYLNRHAKEFVANCGMLPQEDNVSQLGSYPDFGEEERYEYYQQALGNITHNLERTKLEEIKKLRPINDGLFEDIKELTSKKLFNRKRNTEIQKQVQDLIDKCSPWAFNYKKFRELDLRGLDLSKFELEGTDFYCCNMKGTVLPSHIIHHSRNLNFRGSKF